MNKEFYIAPEVEILCFAPVERLANDFDAGWESWSIRAGGGDGEIQDSATNGGEIEDIIPSNPDDGEG